jgi:hypothetical protein
MPFHSGASGDRTVTWERVFTTEDTEDTKKKDRNSFSISVLFVPSVVDHSGAGFNHRAHGEHEGGQ